MEGDSHHSWPYLWVLEVLIACLTPFYLGMVLPAIEQHLSDGASTMVNSAPINLLALTRARSSPID